MKLKSLLLGLLIAGVSAGTSFGGSILSIITNPGGPQLWSDNSGDFLFNRAGGATTVDVGDVLIGQFAINTVEYLGGGGTIAVGSGANNEMSGAFAIEVLSATPQLGGGYDFVFGPTSALSRADIALAYPGAGNFGPELSSWSAGSMAAMFDDPLQDYERENVPRITAIASAINGTKLFEAGFTGGIGVNGAPGPDGLGEGWIANAISNDISIVGSVPLPGIGGGLNLGVNTIPGTVNPALVFIAVPTIFGVGGMADIFGSGSLLGIGGATTAYDSFNDVNFVANVSAVPEPGSLLVWGLAAGFGMIGGVRRRRK